MTDEKKKQELRLIQASIRDNQKNRIDKIHFHTHEMLRNIDRLKLDKDKMIDLIGKIGTTLEIINNLEHEFMRDMDKAVLIHERIAEIDGRDPSELTNALWNVRCYPPNEECDGTAIGMRKLKRFH